MKKILPPLRQSQSNEQFLIAPNAAFVVRAAVKHLANIERGSVSAAVGWDVKSTTGKDLVPLTQTQVCTLNLFRGFRAARPLK